MLSCHLGLLGKVALIIKVTKQSDQAQGVTEHHHIHGVREVTVGIEVERSVNGHNKELELRWTKKDSDANPTDIISLKNHNESLTSWREVRQRFHHKYFCIWGPSAARPQYIYITTCTKEFMRPMRNAEEERTSLENHCLP